MKKLFLLLAAGLLLNACITESPFNEHKPLVLSPPDSCKGPLFSLVRPERDVQFLGESAGGFAFGIRSGSPGSERGFDLLRFDKEGNLVQQKPLSYSLAARALPDGYWLIDTGSVLRRTDDDFNTQRQIPLGFRAIQAVHAADGGLLLLGYPNSTTTISGLAVEKRDGQGNPQWTRKLPAGTGDRFAEILTNARGDQYWLFVRSSDDTNAVETFDLNGNLLGQTNLARLFYNWSLHISGDDGLVVSNYGWTYDGSVDKHFGSLTKYNARLEQEWQEDTGDKGYAFMVPVGDGYLFITDGQAAEKWNAGGKLLWSKPIQKGVLKVYDFVATADGGSLLLAEAYTKTYYGNETAGAPAYITPRSFSRHDYTTLILKLDAEGTYCP